MSGQKTILPGESGSGPGLSLCREIVAGFGGEIAMESELGAGTRVTLTLPAHDGGESS